MNQDIFKKSIDDEYITHRPLEVKEQEDESVEDEDTSPEKDIIKPTNDKDTPPEENIDEPIGDEDISPEGNMIDPMSGVMGGMPGETEPLTKTQIGRIYELKKIYTRLAALENLLHDVVEPDMIELRNLTSKAIDLFKTLSSNFDIYKDKLDDIIVIFYKFLDISYKKVRDYFKNKATTED